MANRRKPLTFSELDRIEPKGKHAILRTPQDIAAEEELLARHQAGDPEIQKPRNPETQKSRNRSEYTKATYRLSPETIEAIEDAKRILRRQHGIKVNLEEIAEEAILAAYRDLMANEQHSNLVHRFERRGVKSSADEGF